MNEESGYSEPVRTGMPPILAGLLIILVAAHCIRIALPSAAQDWLFYTFSLIPLRFDPGSGYGFTTPFGPLAALLGNAFLHGNRADIPFGFIHVGLNAAFLLQGGVPVARGLGEGRRLGLRFLALFFASTLSAALFYLAFNQGSAMGAVGASGAVCGIFGAYFIGIRSTWQNSLRDPQVRAGMAVFLGINVGLAALARATNVLPIAWEAHLGGFLAGAVMYPILQPKRGRGQTPGYPE